MLFSYWMNLFQYIDCNEFLNKMFKVNYKRDIDNRKNLFSLLQKEINLLNHRVEKYKNMTIKDVENIFLYNFSNRFK